MRTPTPLLAVALLACRTAPPAGADPAPPAATLPAPVPATPPSASPTSSADSFLPAAPHAAALSAARMAKEKGVALVAVETKTPAAPDALPLITLTKTELLVGTEHIADVIPGPLGFEAKIKRAGQRAALQVLPLDAVLKSLHAADPGQDSVRFLFDGSTSYRSALEVVFTASHAGFTSFDFVVSSKAGERVIPVSTPSRAEWDAAHTPGATPPPSFVLEPDGVTLSVGTTTIGAGCAKGAAGVAIPAVSGKLDPVGVAACGARLKSLDPAWAGFTVANVSAANGLDLQTVLAVVAEMIPLFPTEHFGMVSG